VNLLQARFWHHCDGFRDRSCYEGEPIVATRMYEAVSDENVAPNYNKGSIGMQVVRPSETMGHSGCAMVGLLKHFLPDFG
jgi:hypothetical protein